MSELPPPVARAELFAASRRPFRRLLFSAVVIGVWIVSLLALARREGFWESSADYAPAFANLRADRVPPPLQMGLYFMGARVGTARSRWEVLPDGHWRNIVEGNVDLSFLNLSRIVFSLDTHIDSLKQLEYFLFKVQSPIMSGGVLGRRNGDHIDVSVNTNGRTKKLRIPYEPGSVVADTFSPSIGAPERKVGASWSVAMIDPLTLRSARATAKITRRETIVVNGKSMDCFVVEIRYGRFKTTAWLDDDGQVVKQQTPLGLTLLREPFQEPGTP